MDISELADACQSLAETLDQEQADENYEGQEAMTLGKLSANLSAQASTLRTLAVAQAIQQSQEAQKAIENGTNAAKNAVKNLKNAGQAIQISGLALTLGAAVISGSPQTIISTGKDLVDAVKNLG